MFLAAVFFPVWSKYGATPYKFPAFLCVLTLFWKFTHIFQAYPLVLSKFVMHFFFPSLFFKGGDFVEALLTQKKRVTFFR